METLRAVLVLLASSGSACYCDHRLNAYMEVAALSPQQCPNRDDAAAACTSNASTCAHELGLWPRDWFDADLVSVDSDGKVEHIPTELTCCYDVVAGGFSNKTTFCPIPAKVENAPDITLDSPSCAGGGWYLPGTG
jgi:hypothetical protein